MKCSERHIAGDSEFRRQEFPANGFLHHRTRLLQSNTEALAH